MLATWFTTGSMAIRMKSISTPSPMTTTPSFVANLTTAFVQPGAGYGVTSDPDDALAKTVRLLRPSKKCAIQLRMALRNVPVPKDIVVTTPEAFEWRKDVTGTIEYPAAHEGRVLYAAP